MTCLSNPFD